MVDVAELTKNIAALAAGPPTELLEADRAALFQAVTQLRDAIQSPLEATLRYSFAVCHFHRIKQAEILLKRRSTRPQFSGSQLT